MTVSAARKAEIMARNVRIAESYRAGALVGDIAAREGISQPLVSLALRQQNAGMSREDARAKWLLAGRSPEARKKAAATRTQSLSDRFFSRVIKGAAADDCWSWTGLCFTNGYPVMSKGNKSCPATHISLELDGRTRPGTLYALHTCDNPKCTNPRHLWWGTQKENIQDAIAKGRMNLDGLALGLAARLGA